MPSTLQRADYVHQTSRGRVVYNRKPHLATEADVARFARSVFFRIHANPTAIYGVLYRISVSMLRTILNLFDAGIFAESVFAWLYDLVDWVLKTLATLLPGALLQQGVNRIIGILATYTPDWIPREPGPPV